MPSSPLAGKRIVNTRAAHQAAELDDLLRERGSQPISYPCIAIVPPGDLTDLDQTLCDLVDGRYDWLVLTSPNTVQALAKRMAALNRSIPDPAPFHTAAVGPSTAEIAQKMLGLHIHVVPDEYIAEALADALDLAAGTRVLLPESAIARPTLAQAIRKSGAHVTVVTAYQTGIGTGGADVPHMLAQRRIDAVVFTSSSTVTNFVERLQQEGGNPDDLRGTCIACIGPKTETTAREQGLDVSLVSESHTLEGLIASLESYFSEPVGVQNGYR